MKIRLKSSSALVSMLLLGCVYCLNAGEASLAGKSLQDAADKCQQPELKKYLISLKGKIDAVKASSDPDFKKEVDSEIASAVKVANDISAGNYTAAQFVYYTVHPMSNIKRTMYT